MTKKILLIRNTPYDVSPNVYNMQEIGIGKAFCRLGYDYDHVCFKSKNQQEWTFYERNGCKARYIEKPRFRFLRWGINRNLLKKEFLEQYDAIISREYYQIMTYFLAQKGRNVSMYNGPYYNMFMVKFFSPIYDFLFTKKMNKLLKGKFVKSVLSKKFLERKGFTDITNVGVGLDTERFDNEEEIKPETQKIVDFMRQNRCLLYVGALSDRKNFPFLLEVYSRVLKKCPDVKFVMIGKSKMSALTKFLGIDEGVYAKKHFDRLPSKVREGIYHIQSIDNAQLKFVYPLAKAFLLPSKLEIFGMVLLEAMYLGAPVISSRNGGSMTIIDGKDSGIVIDSFDAGVWAEAAVNLVEHPQEAARMVKRGREIVTTEYSWDAIAKKMLDVIESRGEK